MPSLVSAVLDRSFIRPRLVECMVQGNYRHLVAGATLTNHPRRRVSSFSWMLSNPPLLKTTTTSFG